MRDYLTLHLDTK